jgi:hypothetical protein
MQNDKEKISLPADDTAGVLEQWSAGVMDEHWFLQHARTP